jgi:hypothetical protein
MITNIKLGLYNIEWNHWWRAIVLQLRNSEKGNQCADNYMGVTVNNMKGSNNLDWIHNLLPLFRQNEQLCHNICCMHSNNKKSNRKRHSNSTQEQTILWCMYYIVPFLTFSQHLACRWNTDIKIMGDHHTKVYIFLWCTVKFLNFCSWRDKWP